jgi:hypothetical protein
VLRLISAVLHERPGSSVTEDALDLRPGELGVLVPLVACLLALSAWPAGITDHSFPDEGAARTVETQFDSASGWTSYAPPVEP